jgi:hypothetical protein
VNKEWSQSELQKIANAVEEWVMAEWQFRLSPIAYREGPTERYLRAERNLRRAVTGRGDLEDAYVELQNRNV